ncbi:MAG: DUF222 domain-containing protein, partial [Actinomycetes bacterium]
DLAVHQRGWVGGSAAGVLADVDPVGLTAGQRVDLLVGWSRQIAHAQAMQARVVAAMARLDNDPVVVPGGGMSDVAAEEVGCALSVSSFTAHQLVEVSRDVTARLPRVWERIAAGEVSWAVAAVLADELPPVVPGHEDRVRRIEALMLDRLARRTPSQVRRLMKRIVHRVCPEQTGERAKQAAKARGVSLFPGRDAMATVCASLPAADAQYVYSVIDRAARRRVTAAKAAKKAHRGDGQGAEGQVPSLDAVRADLFVQLAARLDHDERTATASDGPGGAAAFTAQRTIAVVIDLATVLGLAEHPGELPGYGPVPASVARALAADSTWVRWITDPATGALLDAGRRTYRPSAALREFIVARDIYCRFPTCSARADGITTEIDHADPFHHADPNAGGQTTRQNLGPACKRHHQIKSAGLWSITDSQTDGSCDWLSPTGHRYPHHPENFDDHIDVGCDDTVSKPFDPGLLDPVDRDSDHDLGLPGDHSSGDWWFIEPPGPDETDPHDPDADGLRFLPRFTSLEYRIHHALCA